MENYICIHGHFYQPPRENPWLEAIERQESAHPYHDWNQRISAECYMPNSLARILDENGLIDEIINNYSRISFNFGPTLLSWMEAEDPETYARILEADRLSRDRFSGHGSAMAQGYNHAILPLCNDRDKFTQILWGIRDFKSRFGRMPEGMWLPETAADVKTLDVMAQQGIKFVVLAPHQAKNVRRHGETVWQSVANCGIDPGRAYEIELPGGQNMAIFFYDGAISSAVGFHGLLGDGGNFLNRLMGAFSAERDYPQLIHIAVDGETFGHHHQFGEMALAYAINQIEAEGKVRLTNYGEYLEKHPPSWRVEIWDNSSWSCCHGVERWREDCGCSTGSNPGWRQKWRAPMRRALDELRDQLEPLYSGEAKNLFSDPWNARNDYIDLILDRGPEAVERFFSTHAARPLDGKERTRALELLEMQRYALMMYTSCGWFFDDLAGIETVQVMQYAGRAIQLAEKLSGKSGIETSFLKTLSEAESNKPEAGNGRDLYLKFVRPAIIDDLGIAAHYAMRSLFQNFPARVDLYSRIIDRRDMHIAERGGAKLILGSCSVKSKITGDTADVDFAAIYPWNARACLSIKKPDQDGFKYEDETQKKMAGIRAAFEKEDDMFKTFRLMEEYFKDGCFALKDLIKDERRKINLSILASASADLDAHAWRMFARVTPLVESMLELGMIPPQRFAAIADEHVHSQLLEEFLRHPVRLDSVQSLLDMAERRNINWRRSALEPEIREIIESLARKARQSPGDTTALRDLTAAVKAAKLLPLDVNFYETQNQCYTLLRGHYPETKAAAEKSNADAANLMKEYRTLGKLLSIKIDDCQGNTD
jgi:alpha-amylase/alpha-mannosidase (GH57 family)